MSTLPRISPGATQTSNTNHQFNVDLIDLEKLATLVRDQQQQDSTDATANATSDEYPTQTQTAS